ncbi:hypothetical protein BH09ACT6_BH09ACT6_04490 [soil metagenome]
MQRKDRTDFRWPRTRGAVLGIRLAYLTQAPAVTTEDGRLIKAETVWGVRARFSCHANTGPLEFRATFAGNRVGTWENGEQLAARHFAAGAFELFIGGADNDYFARSALAGRLPERWIGRFDDSQRASSFGVADWMGSRDQALLALPTGVSGLGWRLPGGRPGEEIEINCAISWSRGELARTAAWFAVDTAPQEIWRVGELGHADHWH